MFVLKIMTLTAQINKRVLQKAAMIAGGIIVAGCAGLSSPAKPPMASSSVAGASNLADDYKQLASNNGGHVFLADPATSRVRIYVFRGGKALSSGHNHVLSAPAFLGYAYVPDTLSDARFDLQLRLDQLLVDDPKARVEAGAAFSTKLDKEDIAGTREHMLGAKNLDAAQFPYLLIHITKVVGERPRLIATLSISLHGVTRELLVPMQIDQIGNELQVSGSFAIRQSDFGIVPYSVLGGLLSVQDELSIEFVMKGRPATFSAQP